MPTFFEQQSQLLEAGTPFVCVTLVDATGSTPQDRGSKMLVTEAGLHFGTIGGGKAEMHAISIAREMLAAKERTRFIEWNLQNDLNMVCGGAVKLFLEAFNLTPWRIVIFGAGHVAQALTRLLINLECQINLYDTRAEWIAKLPVSPKLRAHHVAELASAVAEIPAGTFVLCISMGHATDRPVVEKILKTREDFAFLGVIGSASKAAAMRKALREAGVPEEKLSRFTCPLGLPVGSNHPWEIAVSITAQLLQLRDSQNKS
jgi:xanthine dehydrogenase accessory factor